MSKTGLIVEGGGMKCAYSAGILDAFLDKNITFDLDAYRVYVDKNEIDLTGLELKILFYLLENKGILVTRDMIINRIWDESGKFVNDNTLSVYIKRIREKIG